MKKKDKNHIVEMYNRSLKKYGDRAEAVHWRGQTQLLRFRALTQIAKLKSSSVLDIGCGKGDLYGYLKKNGFKGRYEGWDINKNLISLARNKYPDGIFKISDITERNGKIKVDYILISGMFNNRISNNDRFIKETLKKVWKGAGKGLSFNLISDYVNYKEKELYYASPEKIFKYCKENLSRYVVIRHDYMRFDFTVYVYRKKDKY
jgi:SAM-dependent methyltransferase